MTTKGKTIRGRNSMLVPIGPDGELRPMYELADRIADVAARNDEPLVVEYPATLDPAAQRLMATLGVLVRFAPVDSPRGGR